MTPDQIFYHVFGTITIMLSMFGAGFGTCLYVFIRKSKKPLAKALSGAYLADVFLMLVTAGMGVAGMVLAEQVVWQVIYAIRIPILIYAVFALWQLYKQFREWE